MKLEKIMLSEMYQSQKTIYYTIPLILSGQNKQINRERENISGCPARGVWWGGGGGS